MAYYFFFNGAIVLWSSKKEQIILTSTIKAQYIELGHKVRKVIWIKKFINELKLEATKITLYSNNKTCIALTKNAKSQRQTKHIDV